MTRAEAVQGLTLSPGDYLRVCRDLAWSEISAMPGERSRIGPRIAASPKGEQACETIELSWDADSLSLDSLARMQLATSAATWCNAYDSGFEDLFLAKRNVADWALVMQRARASGARHFTFSTSGSTGTRKHIRHREEVLASEASMWAKVVSGCGHHQNSQTSSDAAENSPAVTVKRILVLCPTHHIYGFIWGVLLPQALGVRAFDADIASLPALQSGDLIVAVPDQWAWLADSARHWPPGVQGVSSTALLPDSVHRALTAPPAASVKAEIDTVLPNQRLTRLFQIYGSTETAGLAYRTSPDEPYTLAPQRSRNAAGGIALTLSDGSVVALDVQDELQWSSDKKPRPEFYVLRRSDLSVQVGGHNVSPAWVSDQLRAHPSVFQASVRLSTLAKPPRLKAFVVLNAPDNAQQRHALEAWALEALPWYAKFSSITYGESIPANVMGKPCDWPEIS